MVQCNLDFLVKLAFKTVINNSSSRPKSKNRSKVKQAKVQSIYCMKNTIILKLHTIKSLYTE